jgi:arylsulfatase A-like enzyme
VTLAEALRDHGFETAAATENAALDVRTGMGRGFNSYAENKRQDLSVAEGHIDETLATGLRWIERHRDRRFFLFLHTYQTHYPYTPPERYADLFAEPPAGFEPHPSLPEDRAPALYDREIRHVDDELRRFFGALAELALLDETLLVVTSDHGEGFLEHGIYGHGRTLHGEVLNVPLLLRGPGIPRGLRVAEPVAHVDLMPTLLELAGIPIPPSLMGRSLVPLLRGERGGAPVPVYSEAREQSYPEPSLSVRVGDRKLIRMRTPTGDRHLYFDLAADPGERRNLYAETGAEARDLAALLDAYAPDVTSRGAALRDNGGSAEALGVDPERLEKLRALGYVE